MVTPQGTRDSGSPPKTELTRRSGRTDCVVDCTRRLDRRRPVKVGDAGTTIPAASTPLLRRSYVQFVLRFYNAAVTKSPHLPKSKCGDTW